MLFPLPGGPTSIIIRIVLWLQVPLDIPHRILRYPVPICNGLESIGVRQLFKILAL